MLKNKSKLGAYLLILSATMSPFLYFSGDMKPWTVSSPSALILQHTIQPLEAIWNTTLNKTSQLLNRYVFLIDVEKENEVLRESLSRLQSRIMDYEHKVTEVSRLRTLLGFANNYKEDSILSEVTFSGYNSLFPMIRLNRGTLHQVKTGMPVVSAQGIVGRIIRTGLNFSDVQLTNDSSFSIDAIVERTRVRGVLTGTPENKLRLELGRKMDIKIGDTLITSGIIGGFPKGLPIGKVIKVAYETDQLSQIVTIEPWSDYKKLEEVIIIKHDDRFINMIQETAGSEWLDNRKTGG